MLTLVESKKAKIGAHKTFKANLREAWSTREKRRITWRPSSREMNIFHNGEYWFTSANPVPKDKTPRYWDPYGKYRENGNLQIAVEINIPTDSNSARVKGFYAIDPETGACYLMHDGGVGGGKTGVGKEAFLAWSHARLLPVTNSEGAPRLGIIVAAIDSGTIGDDVARFVQTTADFKQAVQNGETTTPEALRRQRTYKDYFNEFSGKKKRKRIQEVEYISRHGDIVRALSEWRQKIAAQNERIVKNAYIDLGVENDDLLTEIYEVKTSCDRQSLYSAIGQVIVHDDQPRGNCRRFLVLPEGAVAHDIEEALNRADITVVRYRIDRRGVRLLIE